MQFVQLPIQMDIIRTKNPRRVLKIDNRTREYIFTFFFYVRVDIFHPNAKIRSEYLTKSLQINSWALFCWCELND